MPPSNTAFLGLRTAKYSAPDLAAAKAWYSRVLESTPYFDEPFYVGFNVGGFELGITPRSMRRTGTARGGDRVLGRYGRRCRLSETDLTRGHRLRTGGRM